MRWILASALLIFGLMAVGNWTSAKWVLLTLFLYSIPLLLQWSSKATVRAYALWFGIFLVLQTLVTPLVIDRDYKTLPPKMVRRIDVIGDAIPGVSGIQRITTDENGFRVTEKIDYGAKPTGTFRIFALGGSTTEQLILDDQRTWTHLLQEQIKGLDRYRHVEVINNGVSGTRAIHHLASLKRVMDWDADLVIFLMGLNDWNRHIWDELGAPQQYKPGVSSNPVQFSESLAGILLKNLTRDPQKYHNERVQPVYGAYYSRQNNSLQRSDIKTFRPETIAASYRSVVREIAEACRQNKLSCLFVSQPTAYHEHSSAALKKYLWMTPPNTEYTLDFQSLIHVANLYNDFLMDFAEENDVARCDLAGPFEATLEHLHDDCHFNVLGAQHTAEILADCVRRMGL